MIRPPQTTPIRVQIQLTNMANNGVMDTSTEPLRNKWQKVSLFVCLLPVLLLLIFLVLASPLGTGVKASFAAVVLALIFASVVYCKRIQRAQEPEPPNWSATGAVNWSTNSPAIPSSPPNVQSAGSTPYSPPNAFITVHRYRPESHTWNRTWTLSRNAQVMGHESERGPSEYHHHHNDLPPSYELVEFTCVPDYIPPVNSSGDDPPPYDVITASSDKKEVQSNVKNEQ